MPPDDDVIGARLGRLRRQQGLTQRGLAERAGLSEALVQKLEQGRRGSARTSTFIALANALDVDLSELTGKRPRLGKDDDVRVLALRDVLLAPELVLDVSGQPGGRRIAEAASLDDVGRKVATAWRDYWAGRFTTLAGRLPRLVAAARATSAEAGARAAGPLTQSYQLVAYLLVHLGKDDLAALAAERAIHAAATGDDELQWATVHGTFAWALLHQGRTDAAEQHARAIAERIEPSIPRASLEHLTVWGGLLLSAMAAAVAGGRRDAAIDFIGLARSAAGRFESGDRSDYQTNFGPTQVSMQATHAYAVLREPSKALKAADGVRRQDLRSIAWGRHLIDVAQAHVDAGETKAAERMLLDAEDLSPEWFRHQGPARSLVGELVQEARRMSPPLRRLAKSVGVER